MKNESKKCVLSIVIIIFSGLIFSFLINTNSTNQVFGVADFYGVSREINLNQLIEEAEEKNVSLYLPGETYKEFKLTAIYYKNSTFHAIIVYSKEGNKDYKTSELTIELTFASYIPSFTELSDKAKNSSDLVAYEIKRWPVLIHKNIEVVKNDGFIEKYGKYTTATDLWIQGIYYVINTPLMENGAIVNLIENFKKII